MFRTKSRISLLFLLVFLLAAVAIGQGHRDLLKGNEKAKGRLEEFCDTIKAWDGGFAFGLPGMLVIGRDKEGEYAAQTGFELKKTDDDQFAVMAWPDRLYDTR